jgi:hypothetical protein
MFCSLEHIQNFKASQPGFLNRPQIKMGVSDKIQRPTVFLKRVSRLVRFNFQFGVS